jgi:hypothetical protein
LFANRIPFCLILIKVGRWVKGRDAHHGISPLKETFGQVEAYSPCGIMLCIKICDFIPQGEASGAGYEYFHE